MSDDRLTDVIERSRVIVTVGAGGVGKTTTSAALALCGARGGRRCIVVTIDPAKRLADALGVSLTNEPRELVGDWSGSLHALMLDTKGTFDALVARYSKDEQQLQRILSNHFYQNVAASLSGTQDYMAMEKLHSLSESGDYDLIVVDTPPTRHALAFLDAPRLLTRLLENRVYRMLTAPRGLVRAVNSAAHVFIRQITRVVGAEVVDDAVAFFRAFEGMEDGFKERAGSMIELLRQDTTSFVLVTTPRADTIEEAVRLTRQLRDAGIAVRAAIVNRMTPSFPEIRSRAARSLPHATAVAHLNEAARAEDDYVATLMATAGPAATERIPTLARDLSDLAGVELIAAQLLRDRSRPVRSGGGHRADRD